MKGIETSIGNGKTDIEKNGVKINIFIESEAPLELILVHSILKK